MRKKHTVSCDGVAQFMVDEKRVNYGVIRNRFQRTNVYSNVMNLLPSAKTGSSALSKIDASAKLALGSEFSLTIKPLPGEGIMEMFSRLALALKDSDMTLANLMVFGSVNAHPAADEAMRRVFGQIDWPVMWVEGAAYDDHPIAGMQAFAFSAGRVNPITLNGRVVGSVFEDGAIRHCLLGGLGPSLCSASRPDQLRQTLGNLETALEQAGFSLGDVVRTWFYLDRLLSWYGAFNEARTKVYSRIKFRTGSLPASTGISGRNPAGTALVAGAWALQPLHTSAQIAEVPSPLQCPAPAYGSSFSRAMEISSLHGRRLLISGTASVAPGGRTLWPGNVDQQIDLTMEVVEAILVSRGFELSDITRATTYFKNRADIPAFAAWCAGQGLRSLPVIAVQCGICRDDLLFELEADAWNPTPAIEFAI
jgi:enamine deaminase RidA (YjgF/YER057c/UK114 family)